MKLTKIEEAAILDWGVKFFEMGFKAAFAAIAQMESFVADTKVNAVQDFIRKNSSCDDVPEQKHAADRARSCANSGMCLFEGDHRCCPECSEYEPGS